MFLIAVPTFRSELGGISQPNNDFVMAATIAPFLHSGNLILLESTSPVGTTEHLKVIYEDRLNSQQLHLLP